MFRRVLRPALVFLLCALACALLIGLGLHQHKQSLQNYASVPGIVAFIIVARYTIGIILQAYISSVTTIALWRALSTAVVFWFALMWAFVVLATSGNFYAAEIAYFTNGPGNGGVWAIPEGFCWFAIPAALLALPEYLHIKGRSAADASPVPAWLAGFAGTLTAVYIISVHYGGVPRSNDVKNVSLGVWSVAAFGVALLLAPFYRIVAKKCIRRGVVATFDPVLWWRAWCDAFNEIRGTSAAVADGGDTGKSAEMVADRTVDSKDA